MLVDPHVDQFLVWAPAKVNLYLEVTRKRPDHYHDLETVMIAVNLFDTLRFKEDESGRIALSCTDPDLAVDETNLILRAAKALRDHADCRRGVRIELVKRIPMAAGLGGGSSDAAAALYGLNLLWRLNLSQAELVRLGAKLGSDVAFFLHAPAAWCTGRGEIVTPLALPAPLWLVLVKPPMGLPTAEVFGALRLPETQRSGAAIRQALATGDPTTIGRHLYNRLHEPAGMLRPELAKLKDRMEGLNPLGCVLSGSGTSLFALCRDAPEASRIGWALRTTLEPGTEVFVARSCRPTAT